MAAGTSHSCGSGRALTHLSRPNSRERECRRRDSELSPFLFFTQCGIPAHKVVSVTVRAASPSLNSSSVEIRSHLNVDLHRVLNPVKVAMNRHGAIAEKWDLADRQIGVLYNHPHLLVILHSVVSVACG